MPRVRRDSGGYGGTQEDQARVRRPERYGPGSGRPGCGRYRSGPTALDLPAIQTPARFLRCLPIALPCVGVVVELHALASGDGAGKPRLAVPRRTPQPSPLSRLLVAKPIDLRIAWWIPMSTPAKSVTVGIFQNRCWVSGPGVEFTGKGGEEPLSGEERAGRLLGGRENGSAELPAPNGGFPASTAPSGGPFALVVAAPRTTRRMTGPSGGIRIVPR